MRLVADTHVHIYPFYDVKLALHTLRNNLSQLDKQATCLAFLAERSDCDFFSNFEQNVDGLLNAKMKVRYLKDALHLQESGYPDLYIFPGRQIITSERIEILSLTVDQRVPDNLPAIKVVEKIRQNKGIPILSWAPGKWFFKRKQVVKDLIDSSQPGSLLIGDTTLRPTCWPLPLLMKKATHKGLTVINGSDPLPFVGEEHIMGQYGIQTNCDFDPANPVKSIRSLLTQPELKLSPVGYRGNLFSTLRRLYNNSKSKNLS